MVRPTLRSGLTISAPLLVVGRCPLNAGMERASEATYPSGADPLASAAAGANVHPPAYSTAIPNSEHHDCRSKCANISLHRDSRLSHG
jgi:hypothetical protein